MKINTGTKLIIAAFWTIIVSNIAVRFGTHAGMGIAGISLLSAVAAGLSIAFFFFIEEISDGQ